MTLFNEATSLLKNRGIEFTEKFVPPLLSSFACHLINLENRKRKFYYEHDRIPDLRLHVLIVSPPGFGRSFIFNQLVDETYGILNASLIPMRFEGYATEAGFIGSIEKDRGTTTRMVGLFEEFKDGIVAIEEFFAISKAMEQKHSAHLEPALNQALLDGNVRKRLKGGIIEYHTDLTLWAGTQTTRFEVGGGLLRRFLLVNWVPNEQEQMAMRRAYWRGTNLKLAPEKLHFIRGRFMDFYSNLKNIEKIQYTEAFKESLNDRPHFEIAVLRKYALGLTLISKPFEREVIVDYDPDIQKCLDDASHWRRTLTGDPEGDLIRTVVKDSGGKIEWLALKKKLITFSMRFDVADAIIKRMVASHDLYYKDGTLWLPEVWKSERK